LFFGDEGNLVILDEIGSLRPVAVDWLVHAAGLRAPDVSENRMTIQGGRVDLAGTVIAPDRFDFKLMPVADGRPERFLSVSIRREAGTRNVMVVFAPYQRRLGPPALQATRLAGSSNGDVVRFEGSSGLHYMVSHNLGSTGTVWSLEREQAGVALTTD